MPSRLVLVAGLLVVVVVVAITLAPSEPRRSGTNNVPLGGPVATLEPDDEICQQEDVPGQTRVVRLRVEASEGIPRPVVRVQGTGRPVAGRRSHVAAEGVVDVTLGRDATPGAAEVCIRNSGRGPLVVIGYPTGDRDGEPTGPIRLDYYRPGSESWLQVASTIADRVARGQSGLLGVPLLWLAVAMVLAAWALAAAALWRVGDPR